MKKMLDDEWNYALAGSIQRTQEYCAPDATTWLTDHLERLSRTLTRRSEPAADSPSAIGGRASSLWDASIQLDVAATIYRLLLEQGSEDVVSLSDCLARVCATALDPLAIRVRCQLEFYCEPGCTIPAAHAFPVAAIAMEAMTNALRHAHPAGVRGRLSIGCHRRDDDLIVEIEDDGVGTPEAFELRSDAGVGLRSAADMAADIGARLSVDSRPLGLTVRLKMRAARASALPTRG